MPISQKKLVALAKELGGKLRIVVSSDPLRVHAFERRPYTFVYLNVEGRNFWKTDKLIRGLREKYGVFRRMGYRSDLVLGTFRKRAYKWNDEHGCYARPDDGEERARAYAEKCLASLQAASRK